MTIVVGVVVLVAVAMAITLAIRSSRRPSKHAVAVPVNAPVQEVPAPAEPEPAMTWTAELTASALDEPARLRLIDDLVMIAAPWTVTLLRRAHDEERSATVRGRIESALAAVGEPIASEA